MQIKDIPVPEVYKTESADFRFFLRWFENCLNELNYATENIYDLYDCLRCPSWLLWMLADTMGYKYDDRLPASFCRLVLLYFMSMIRLKGSRNGITLAAEVNLAQFSLIQYGKEKDILNDRLEDTTVPTNSVYVTAHANKGYIDVVYFSDRKPIDACIEYVRPLGMYIFQHAGVSYDARTKVSVDARLTNTNDLGVSIGATHVGHYSREDYARMQKMKNEESFKVNKEHKRRNVWYSNSEYEGDPKSHPDAGWRSLYSLQVSNNEHITKSLFTKPIFSLGYGPQDVSVRYPDNYLDKKDDPIKNLRYDRKLEESMLADKATSPDVYTVDSNRTTNVIRPRPAVNPVLTHVGDAISLNPQNTKYTKAKSSAGDVEVVDAEDL